MSPILLFRSLKPLKMSRVAIFKRNLVTNIGRKRWPLTRREFTCLLIYFFTKW